MIAAEHSPVPEHQRLPPGELESGLDSGRHPGTVPDLFETIPITHSHLFTNFFSVLYVYDQGESSFSQVGLHSFMNEGTYATGCEASGDERKKDLAGKSKAYNLHVSSFILIFLWLLASLVFPFLSR